MNNTLSLKVLSERKELVLISALALSIFFLTGFVWAYKTVDVQVDGQAVSIRTLHSKPTDILAEAGVEMGPQDEYRLSTPSVQNGTVVEVLRAFPVTVQLKEGTKTVMTAKQTVGELAGALGFKPETVRTEPGDGVRLSPNMTVRLVKIETRMETREIPDPFSVMQQPDATLEKGASEVLETGTDGVKEVAVRVTLADGESIGEQVVSEKVKVASKAQTVRVGTRDVVNTSRGDQRFSRTLTMEATAYLPTDGGGHGITASGIPARWGVVAVDPRVIPLGTRLYIPGYGYAVAADTGGAIKGMKIDLCMEDYAQAWGFGRRYVKVYVLED